MTHNSEADVHQAIYERGRKEGIEAGIHLLVEKQRLLWQNAAKALSEHDERTCHNLKERRTGVNIAEGVLRALLQDAEKPLPR